MIVGFSQALRSLSVDRIAIRAILITALASGSGYAQPISATAPAPQMDDGSSLTVYLLTIGPGAAIWERFGHNAIWIHDAARSSDTAYNWGLFDFDESDFYIRFARGDMRYWMGALGFAETISFYERSNRSIYSQELNLTPSERLALRDFVEWNALPQNRYYSYDYFRDNCSTRARDALDRVLGGIIRAATDRTITRTTYRSHTRRLMQSERLIYTGIHLGLGEPADKPITVWEEMFLPMRMRESLRAIRVPRSGGATVPLVTNETEIFRSTRFPEPLSQPHDLPVYLAIGIVIGALFGAYAGVAPLRQSNRSFAIAAGLWSLLVGIAGTVIAGLWLFTHHVYSYRNENLFQANPVSLILAFALFAIARKSSAEVPIQRRPFVLRLALVVAALSLLGFVIQVLPQFDQANGEIIGLLLPANVAIALVLLLRPRLTLDSGASASADRT